MAANVTKSLSTKTYAFIFLAGALLIGSCQEPKPGGKDTVCISVPKDTSALGRRDHFIPVMSIDLFRKDFAGIQDSLRRSYPNLYVPQCETFNKKQLTDVLNLPTCVGLKFYYGIKDTKKRKELRLMIVGVDSAGHDLYIKKGSTLATQASDENGGLEYGQCSPPCDIQQP